MARLEQSLERRERALSSTSLPPRNQAMRLSSRRSSEGLESTQERALARELATLKPAGLRVWPSYRGAGPETLIRLDSSVATPSCR